MSDAVDKLKEAAARNAEINEHVAAVAAEQQTEQEQAAQQAEPKGGENGNARTGT